MPLEAIPDEPRPFTGVSRIPEQPPPAPPTWYELWDAAFHLNNSLVNGYEYLTRPAFPYDPSADIGAELKKRGWWEDEELRTYFTAAGSIPELDYMAGKRAQEQKRRDVAARGGWAGYAAYLAAGAVLDPIMLLPIVGEARGIRAFFTSASLAGAATGAQETILQLNQTERSIDETLANITMDMIFGGTLGYLVKNFTPRERARITNDMLNPPEHVELPPPMLTHLDPTPEPEPHVPVTRRSVGDTVVYEGPHVLVETAPPPRAVEPPVTSAQLNSAYSGYDLTKVGEIRGGGIHGFDTSQGHVRLVDGTEESVLNGGKTIWGKGGVEIDPFAVTHFKNEGGGWVPVKHPAPQAVPVRKTLKAEGVTTRLEADGQTVRILSVDAKDGPDGKAILRSVIADAIAQGRMVVSNAPLTDDVRKLLKSLHDDGYNVKLGERGEARVPTESEASFRQYFGEPPPTREVPLDTESGRSFREFFGGVEPGRPVERPTFSVHAGLNKEAQAALAAEAAAAPKPKPVGADVATVDVGGIAVNAGYLRHLNIGTNQLARLSDAQLMLLQSDFLTIRNAGWKAFDAGLEHEGAKIGLPTIEGGNISARTPRYRALIEKGVVAINKAYEKYRFGKPLRGIGKNIRATIAGAFGEKLNPLEFRQAVSRQIVQRLRKGESSGIPEVDEVAQYIVHEIQDPIYKEAREVDVVHESAVPEDGDVGFLNYVFLPELVLRHRDVFLSRVSKHIMKALNANFRKKWDTFVGRQARIKEAIGAAELPADEAIKLRDQFLERLKSEDLKPTELEDLMTAARSRMNDKKLSAAERKTARAEVKALQKQGGQPLEMRQAERRDLKRRVSDLNMHAAAFSEKQAAKLDSIARLEDQNLATWERVTRKSAKVLAELDDYSPKAYAAALRDLRNEFARIDVQHARMEERILKSAGGTKDEVIAAQMNRTGKLTDIAEQLARAEDVNPDLARLLIEEANTDILDKANRLNNRRAMQMQRLDEQAKALDPKQAEAWVKTLRERLKAGAAKFTDTGTLEKPTLAGKAEPGGGYLAGKPSFEAYAVRAAEDIAASISKEPGYRLTYSTVSQGERGTELARHLNLPYSEAEMFLQTDIEQLLHSYVNTLGPDIELKKTYGSVKVEEMFDYQAFAHELNDKLAAVKTAVDKKGNPLSEEAKIKERSRLGAMEKRLDDAFRNTISRIRGTWALPTNPQGMAYRILRGVREVTVFSKLGGVFLASIPDVGRIVGRHTLASTFAVPFDAMTSGFKSIKLSHAAGKRGGAITDMVMHTQAYTLSSMMQELGHRNRLERGIKYLADKTGLLALYDGWNTIAKTWTSGAVNINTMHYIDTFLHAEHGSAAWKEAEHYLAVGNLTGDLPRRIWAQVEKGGGEQVNGHWYPDIEKWKDPIAERAYLASLTDRIQNTIIAPGLERPFYSDSTELMKAIFQFRGFSLATTPKTLMHAAQQRDAAVFNGFMISLALGALSDYLAAAAAGGQVYDRYMKANRFELADRAVSRSGLQGSFQLLADVFDKIPISADTNLAQVTGLRFTNTRVGAATGSSLLSAILGPNYRMLEDAAAIVVGLHHPTKSTVHKGRQIFPLQNFTGLRRTIDSIEAAVGAYFDLPGKDYNP